MHKVYDVDNGGIVDAGTPVVLKTTGNNGKLVMTKTDLSSGDGQTNSLRGTPTKINTTGANNYYVLNYTAENGVGFYKLSDSGTIGANKAYLQDNGAYEPDGPAREFFLFEDDDATGIDMPRVAGRDTDAVVYDLQGRRVQNPTKGLYIVNGKKVIIK